MTVCPTATASLHRHSGIVVALWSVHRHGGIVVALWSVHRHDGVVEIDEELCPTDSTSLKIYNVSVCLLSMYMENKQIKSIILSENFYLLFMV